MLKFSDEDAMYILHCNELLESRHLHHKCIDVMVVGEMAFGGDGNSDIEVDQIDANLAGDDTENVITCSYSNTDGSAYDKLMAIELETAGDRDFMATELNLKAEDASILTNRLGAWASIVDGSNYTYKRGKRVVLNNSKKKSGYGTGIVTKESNTLAELKSS